MKNRLVVIFLISIIQLLLGCATPYGRVGLTGGFSDTQLQRNVFSVSFRGNGYTSTDRAMDFALLRCAELTINNGFNYFKVNYIESDSKRFMHHSGQINGGSYSGRSIPISKPRVTINITCYIQNRDNNMEFYEAEFLAESVSHKYNMIFE